MDAATEEMLPELVRLLRSIASEADGQWQSFGVLFQHPGEGVITIVDDLVTPAGLRSAWIGDSDDPVIHLVREWLAALQTDGKPWFVLGVGAERESGNFDAFFRYPGSESESEWDVTPATTNKMMAQLWELLDIAPKPAQ